LEKVAYGPFSDSGFVAGRKRRDFCGLHSTQFIIDFSGNLVRVVVLTPTVNR
jgi:hypothetical protein